MATKQGLWEVSGGPWAVSDGILVWSRDHPAGTRHISNSRVWAALIGSLPLHYSAVF